MNTHTAAILTEVDPPLREVYLANTKVLALQQEIVAMEKHIAKEKRKRKISKLSRRANRKNK